jgi:hypothetical protein
MVPAPTNPFHFYYPHRKSGLLANHNIESSSLFDFSKKRKKGPPIYPSKYPVADPFEEDNRGATFLRWKLLFFFVKCFFLFRNSGKERSSCYDGALLLLKDLTTIQG